MAISKSSVFVFADVEVREREHCLVKAGEVLAVEPRVFRLLLYLLRNPRKLITKEELLNAVWDDAAVTENSLTRSILKLRRLLNDDPHDPRYIETISKVGYRFMVPVESLPDRSEEENTQHLPNVAAAHRSGLGAPTYLSASGNAERLSPIRSAMWMNSAEGKSADSPANEMSAAAAAKPSREIANAPGAETKSKIKEAGSRVRRGRLLLSAIAVLVACVAAAAWYLHRPFPPIRISTYAQVTRDRRQKALIGTDGSRLFFNSYNESTGRPAEVSIAGGDVVPIPVALPEPWAYDVSPDGTALLVTSHDGDRGSLWSLGAEGNSLRHLADGNIGSAGWSPDGEYVAYSTLNGEIRVMRSDGTGARVLGTVPYRTQNVIFERISWSPDGRTIRFDRNNRIYEVSLHGSGPHPFLPAWRPTSWQCCGRWTPDGKFFLFLEWDLPMQAYPLIPPFQIWAFDERHRLFLWGTREPFQLTSGLTRWARPVPAKDGEKIFARGVNLAGELELFDAQSHQFQPYLGGISAEGVSYSPDGKSVAYVTFPEGILWRTNLDGSNRTQLTNPPLYPALPRWSPDGKQILFAAADTAGHAYSYIVSPNGGTPQPILPGYKFEQSDPYWSPDGRRIVFDSLDGEGETAKRVTRILDIANHQVITLPGENFSVRWSPQGRYLAGLSHDASDLMLFDFETARWTVLEKGRVDFPSWSHDGRFIYFLRVSGNAGLYRIQPAGGQEERIVDLKGFQYTGYFGFWIGLDPEDNLLVLRDLGGDDIYSLTLEEK